MFSTKHERFETTLSNSQSRKSISLSAASSPFRKDARYLVVPVDLSFDFDRCAVTVLSHSGTGAWLQPENVESRVPEVSSLLLIEFEGEFVHSHEVRVLNREGDNVLVSLPYRSEKERSLLAPCTGRHDYRIEVNLPVRVKTDWVEAKDAPPKLARLVDLSRGGMALLAPSNQDYEIGQEITVRVVGWDHPIRIEAEVDRVSPADSPSKNRVALRFPADMDLTQREMISGFILQVQRRQALGRALPSVDSGDDIEF